MPSKRAPFTPSSILFRPRRSPRNGPWALVEAPGTAPGSEWFIPMSVYRHIRPKPAPFYIGPLCRAEKPLKTSRSGVSTVGETDMLSDTQA